jgi:hypothetical protein
MDWEIGQVLGRELGRELGPKSEHLKCVVTNAARAIAGGQGERDP